MALYLVNAASHVALLRATRRHGVDDVGNGFDELPVLPVFDAHGEFVPSAEELVCIEQASPEFPEVLTRFTWRFKQLPLEKGGLDYECSLAATVANGPQNAATELLDMLCSSTGAVDYALRKSPLSCADCAICINKRSLGRLCALPTCGETLHRDGTALKLCSRCLRCGYCSREVRLYYPHATRTTPYSRILFCPMQHQVTDWKRHKKECKKKV